VDAASNDIYYACVDLVLSATAPTPDAGGGTGPGGGSPDAGAGGGEGGGPGGTGGGCSAGGGSAGILALGMVGLLRRRRARRAWWRH